MPKPWRGPLITPEEFAERWTPEPNTGCWLWLGASSSTGYGKIGTGGVKSVGAHRVSYEIHKKVSPGNLWVLHKCDVPFCVNPDHLFLGTNLDNMADMRRKGRGHVGPRNGRAKLSEEDAKEIKRSPGLSLRELADKFGVSPAAIYLIRTGQTWIHLGKEDD